MRRAWPAAAGGSEAHPGAARPAGARPNKITYSWDALERRYHLTYDQLLRPDKKEVTVSGSTTVLERTIYGEVSNGNNMRGRVAIQYDSSGMHYVTGYDFKGVPYIAMQVLTEDKKNSADWTTIDPLLLQTEMYGSVLYADALGRPKSRQTNIYSSVDDPNSPNRVWDGCFSRAIVLLKGDTGKTVTTYDKAGVAATMSVSNLRGQNKDVVTGQRYNAKGQQEAVWYANGTKTSYTWDAENYRLRRMLTVQLSTNDILQDLRYWYDAAGNIKKF